MVVLKLDKDGNVIETCPNFTTEFTSARHECLEWLGGNRFIGVGYVAPNWHVEELIFKKDVIKVAYTLAGGAAFFKYSDNAFDHKNFICIRNESFYPEYDIWKCYLDLRDRKYNLLKATYIGVKMSTMDGICFDGEKVYVADKGSYLIDVYDRNGNAVNYLTIGAGGSHLVCGMTTDKRYLWLLWNDGTDSIIQMIPKKSFSPWSAPAQKTITITGHAYTGLTTDGKYLYVSNI